MESSVPRPAIITVSSRIRQTTGHIVDDGTKRGKRSDEGGFRPLTYLSVWMDAPSTCPDHSAYPLGSCLVSTWALLPTLSRILAAPACTSLQLPLSCLLLLQLVDRFTRLCLSRCTRLEPPVPVVTMAYLALFHPLLDRLRPNINRIRNPIICRPAVVPSQLFQTPDTLYLSHPTPSFPTQLPEGNLQLISLPDIIYQTAST